MLQKNFFPGLMACLTKVSENFIVAAAFGNVHGVYKPGNIVLKPIILNQSQQYIKEKFNTHENPVNFVFHGGSGSSEEEIREAISYGVIKMNIDTDTQRATWNGVLEYYEKNKDYLQTQIGIPGGRINPIKSIMTPGNGCAKLRSQWSRD